MNETSLTAARGTLRWSGTAVMGILNATPDSFSDGNTDANVQAAIRRGLAMMNQGALIIDVGGESTRPGAPAVPEQAELARVLPVVAGLAAMGVPVSIDTLKPRVAKAALEAGAWLVNDVSGLRDPQMVAVCAEAGSPAVIMHMQGEPRTMQENPVYADVVSEVSRELADRAEAALNAGLPGVLIDPGIGFGKTLSHNLELLRNLDHLSSLGWPLLLGVSRKATIGRLAGVPQARDRDAGSIAAHLYGARHGVQMIRVHDVAGHVQALAVQRALEGDTHE